MKKILSVFIVCLLLSSVAYAQLGGLRKKMPVGSSSSASAEQVVQKYSVASAHALNAQARLLSAFGLKEDAEAARDEARKLTEGTLSGKDIEETERIVTDSTKKLQEKMADESFELDEEGKKEYDEGRSYLAKAALAYTDTAMDTKGYKPGANVASVSSAATLAVNLGKNLPGDISRLRTVIGMVKDYSKAHNISDDEELEDATKSLTF
jgi:hypothetical protein